MTTAPQTRFLLALLLALAISATPPFAHALPAAGSGETAAAEKNYAEALERLRKAQETFPYDQAIRANLIQAYISVGKTLLDRKQYEEALAVFDQALELDGDSAEFLLGRGIALAGLRRYDDARFALERSLLLGGDHWVPLTYLGQVYYDTGKLEEAIAAWRRALPVAKDREMIDRLIAKAEKDLKAESRMGKDATSRFQLSYDAGTERQFAAEILDMLETAYNRVGYDLGRYPEAPVQVIVYTRQEFRATTGGPEWSGGIYDGKIRLPVGGLREVPPQMQAVLSHEYTHVVIREITRGNCPTWLNEGLAQVEERGENDRGETELREAARSGKLLPMAKLEGSFLGLAAREARLAYRQSRAMTAHLIDLYGWHKVRDILSALGEGLPIARALDKAFREYGIGSTEVMQELSDYLKKEYGASLEPVEKPPEKPAAEPAAAP